MAGVRFRNQQLDSKRSQEVSRSCRRWNWDSRMYNEKEKISECGPAGGDIARPLYLLWSQWKSYSLFIYWIHQLDVCFVYELLGSNLLDLIKYYNYHGIPMEEVKQLTRDVEFFLCLHCHRCWKDWLFFIPDVILFILIWSLKTSLWTIPKHRFLYIRILWRKWWLGPSSYSPSSSSGDQNNKSYVWWILFFFMSIAELEELKLKLKDNTLTPEEKKSLKNKIKNKQKKINEKNKNKSIFPPFWIKKKVPPIVHSFTSYRFISFNFDFAPQEQDPFVFLRWPWMIYDE